MTLIGKWGEAMHVVRLVKKAKKGSKKALLQLIMMEKDAYYKLAFTYMGNEHDAMDAMAEMIVTLYEKIDQLKKEAAFYSWSKTILVNECKTLLQRRKKVVLVDEFIAANGKELGKAVNGDPYSRSENQIDIQSLLVHLSDQQKEAIQLKYFHDLDYETIATMMNVSVGTAKSRVFYGLKKLRDQYGSDHNGKS